MDRRKSDREPGVQTRSFERLSLLTTAVTGLREDLTAYRRTLDRYLRRGTGAVVALVIVGLLLAFLAVQSIATQRSTDHLVEELRRSEIEHRVRNEALHACLVDLIYEVVTTPAEERTAIKNPCPEPIDPEG